MHMDQCFFIISGFVKFGYVPFGPFFIFHFSFSMLFQVFPFETVYFSFPGLTIKITVIECGLHDRRPELGVSEMTFPQFCVLRNDDINTGPYFSLFIFPFHFVFPGSVDLLRRVHDFYTR